MSWQRTSLALVAVLWMAAPAQAAWTFVAARGTNIDASALATVSTPPNANISADAIVVVYCGAHTTAAGTTGSTTNHSVSDTDGHTWTRLHEHSNDPGADEQSASVWITKATTTIATTDAITCNSGDANSLGKVIAIAEFAVAVGKTFSRADSAASSTNGTTTDAVVSSLSSTERLWIGLSFLASNTGTNTLDADYTETIADAGIGSGAHLSSARIEAGHRIATLTGDTYTTTIGATRQVIAILVAVDEVDAGGGGTPGCKNGLLLLGAGC